MIKNQKSAGNKSGNAVFYKPIGKTAEVRSGYMYKSPPPKRLKTEKSWKKRYFVLFKIGEEEHLLKYFKGPDEKDMPLGGIDLSQISVLYVGPEKHQKWNWVQKTHRCSASCVLLIKAAERDYFLVADNSEEADGWFADLYEALKNRPHQRLSPEEMSFGPPAVEANSHHVSWKNNSGGAPLETHGKIRSESDPCSKAEYIYSEKPKEDQARRRASEPLNPIYDYPKAFIIKPHEENTTSRRKSDEAIYESMYEMRKKARAAQSGLDLQSESEHEYEEINTGTLMRSVTKAFEKMRTHITGLPSFDEETADEHRREQSLTPDFSSSSSSSDNGAVSAEEMLEDQKVQTPKRSADREFQVMLADLKKHLTVTDVERTPKKEKRLTPYFNSSSSDSGAVSGVEVQEEKNGQTQERPTGRDVLVKQADLKKTLTEPEVEIKPRKDKRLTPYFNSSSRDSGAVSAEEMQEEKNGQTQERPIGRDVLVKQADLKKPLTVPEVERKPRIKRRLTPYFNRSSRDSGAVSAEEMQEEKNGQTQERRGSIGREIDFVVKHEDLKKHLTLTEVDGSPRVSGWTCQPQTVCLFHKEDQILAINDLQTGSLQEFNAYLSKCRKNEVKLTTLRLPGSQPFYSPHCSCSD
ncbi:plekhs1 [Pungitius sinensis]